MALTGRVDGSDRMVEVCTTPSGPSAWKQLRENVYHLGGEPGGAGGKVYLVRGTRRNVLIDAGLPSDFPFLESHLAELGLEPGQIDMVMLTHEHMDHIGSAPRFPRQTMIGAHPRAASWPRATSATTTARCARRRSLSRQRAPLAEGLGLPDQPSLPAPARPPVCAQTSNWHWPGWWRASGRPAAPGHG